MPWQKQTLISLLLVGICLSVFAGSALATKSDAKWNRAVIKPSIVRLKPGQQQKFKVIMLATHLLAAQAPKEVNWSVNNIPGGNKEIGTIDANGIYTAPAKAPKPVEVHICAEAPEATNKFLFATVLMGEPKYKLVNTWSEEIETAEHLESPHGICLDKEGNIVIADQSGKVPRFTVDGKHIDYIAEKGGDPGEVTKPRVVQLDACGHIWVTDSKGDRPRVQVFNQKAELIRIFGEKGNGLGQLLRPHGLGFDSKGRAFISDVDNFKVAVYTHDGEFLYEWGKAGVEAGEFNAPHGLVVDPSGDVFISGYYGPTQKFDAQGNYLFGFAHGDPPDGPVYFHTITGDKWGNVYLMVRTKEGGQGELQKNATGRHISIMKYNNNGDFVTDLSMSSPDHKESWAVVADDGTVHSLFESETHVGVQTFVPE